MSLRGNRHSLLLKCHHVRLKAGVLLKRSTRSLQNLLNSQSAADAVHVETLNLSQALRWKMQPDKRQT
ncbi:hypothetical protein GN956_G21689 [Arapaima gigas]